MRKLTALILLLALSAPAHSQDYDPQHTMLELNMAIVSVNRILTTKSRAILEEEYSNIINNLSLGNIENDRDMLSIISRKKVAEGYSKMLKSYYDAAEQRRITYALSSIQMAESQIRASEHRITGLETVSRIAARMMQNNIAGIDRETQAQIEAAQHKIDGIDRETQAKLKAARNDIDGIDRETQAQLMTSQNRIDNARSDINKIRKAQDEVAYCWLGNMAVSCASFFAGDIFAVGNMFVDTALSYAGYQALQENRENAERNYNILQAERGEISARQARLRQQAQDNLEQTRITQSNRRQQAQDELKQTRIVQSNRKQKAQDERDLRQAEDSLRNI